MRLLVVEDDPMTQEILQIHYSAMGFSVAVAANGGLALQAMEAQKPDLVICDRVMPAMSGAELLDAVRKRGAIWADVLFVFLTALTDRRDHYAMLSLHPDAYLHKPIMFDEADRKLAQLLHKKRNPPPPPA